MAILSPVIHVSPRRSDLSHRGRTSADWFPSSADAAPFTLSKWLLFTVAIGLSACADRGDVTRLEDEVQRLRAELEANRTENRERLDALAESGEGVSQRLEAVEQRSRDALDQAATAVTQQATRFERLEQNLGTIVRRVEKAESVAYLPVGFEGHTTLRNEHGTFLVRLENVLPTGTGGYRARLNIGNPLGLTVQEFTLKGDYGSPAPQIEPGETYEAFGQRIDEWETTVRPFEATLAEVLPPGQWTQFNVPIPAASLDEIEMLRFSMVVRRALLAQQEGPVNLAVMGTEREGATVVETRYGAFLFTLNGTEPSASGTLLKLAVANPYAFLLNQALLRGEFGPAAPRRGANEPLDLYSERVSDWRDGLQTFEARIHTPIRPFQWSDAEVVIPTQDPKQLEYIRFQFDPESVNLPVPDGVQGPR